MVEKTARKTLGKVLPLVFTCGITPHYPFQLRLRIQLLVIVC